MKNVYGGQWEGQRRSSSYEGNGLTWGFVNTLSKPSDHVLRFLE